MTSMTFFIKRKADKTFFEQLKEGEIMDTNEQERELAEKDLAEELM
jgi:hypothetical protein